MARAAQQHQKGNSERTDTAISPSICAVVITYHPDPVQLEKLVKRTLRQVSCLVIVDNGSSTQEISVVQSLSQDPLIKGLSVIELGKNLGVATAQNRGISWAEENLCDYVLFLDQDSIPSEDMVSCLLSAYTRLSHTYNVAAVGPVYKDAITGNRAIFTETGFVWSSGKRHPAGCITTDILISSGSLTHRSVFKQVQAMDESLFIDNVDTEWCLRAKAKGYQSFGVPDAILNHSLGEMTYTIWFGRWRHVPQHKPFRYYYMFRNCLILYRRAYIPLQWKIRSLIKMIYLLVFGIICMPERYKRLNMIVRGISDGVCGKTGKLKV